MATNLKELMTINLFSNLNLQEKLNKFYNSILRKNNLLNK